MPAIHHCDVAIVGGGLSGALIALALNDRRPGVDVRLIEATDRIGGNHLWSFFSSDIADADRWLVAPLVSHGWTGYDVAFPAHRRTLSSPYYSITSERLDGIVRRTLPAAAVMTGRKVLGASARAVVLADGDRVEAGGVIDARGAGDLRLMELGWQKFVGHEIALNAPHDCVRPLVMDATVDQTDGYRFVYCLPFASTRIFVEDTYYSDHPALDIGATTERIAAYVTSRGWHPEARAQADSKAGNGTGGGTHDEVRTEAGVLPVAMGGDFESYWRSGGNRVAKAGMRAGLFHPTTGYSLPDAVRTATLIAAATDLSGGALHDLTHGFARVTWNHRGFYRMLDKMLFRAAEPDERYRILQRFYRLRPGLIARFYAGQSTMGDKLRLLAGRPPVSIGRAIRALAPLHARNAAAPGPGRSGATE